MARFVIVASIAATIWFFVKKTKPTQPTETQGHEH